LSPTAVASASRLYAAIDSLLPVGAEDLFGTWSIVDTDVALMLNRLVMNGDAVPTRLAEYASRQWKRPAVQLWVKMSRPPLS